MADGFERFGRYPSLEDKVVFISGGSSGIGASFVQHFAHQGAKVGFVGLGQELGEGVVASCAGAKHRPLFRVCDVTNTKAYQGVLAEIATALGDVQVLVNSAANDDRHKTGDVSEDYWERTVGVNLKHYFFATQAVVPAMRKAGAGSIINIGSNSWMLKSPIFPVYAMCNAAILGLSMVHASEFGGDRIRVNCLTPGWVKTPKQVELWLTPEGDADRQKGQCIKDWVEPPDIARMALFLAADDSRLVTAQNFVVDAGWP